MNTDFLTLFSIHFLPESSSMASSIRHKLKESVFIRENPWFELFRKGSLVCQMCVAD